MNDHNDVPEGVGAVLWAVIAFAVFIIIVIVSILTN